MEILFGLVLIVQSMSIALGVGCSTLAIINFFVAISDGKIDATERKMMGVVYIVLRVAMVLILLTTVLGAYLYGQLYSSSYLTTINLGIWTIISVLYLNAFLMTKHVMPSKLGPGIQAGSWYTLGILTSLITVGWTYFYYSAFLIGYFSMLILAVGIVNVVILKLNRKN